MPEVGLLGCRLRDARKERTRLFCTAEKSPIQVTYTLMGWLITGPPSELAMPRGTAG